MSKKRKRIDENSTKIGEKRVPVKLVQLTYVPEGEGQHLTPHMLTEGEGKYLSAHMATEGEGKYSSGHMPRWGWGRDE